MSASSTFIVCLDKMVGGLNCGLASSVHLPLFHSQYLRCYWSKISKTWRSDVSSLSCDIFRLCGLVRGALFNSSYSFIQFKIPNSWLAFYETTGNDVSDLLCGVFVSLAWRCVCVCALFIILCWKLSNDVCHFCVPSLKKHWLAWGGSHNG